MTPQELAELLKYIETNNSWAKKYETCNRNRRTVKYVDAIFDSRYGKVWLLTFRQGGFRKEFEIDKPEDIKAVYAWLDETIE